MPAQWSVTMPIITTLQRQKTNIPRKEISGPQSQYIHVSVSELYIPTMGLPVLLEEIFRLILGIQYIKRSKTHECGNWGWGRAIPRKGIYKRNFRCSVQYWNRFRSRHCKEELPRKIKINAKNPMNLFWYFLFKSLFSFFHPPLYCINKLWLNPVV